MTPTGFAFIVQGLVSEGLLHLPHRSLDDSGYHVVLTFAGWDRYEELKRGVPSGYKAFMAMKFGDPVLDDLFDKHFREAVRQTGFTLQRLDDEPRAGSIDDRLRVEIKSSRFLIADLTHENNGAYWEAGYAEGLGKPVIYTCEVAKFNVSKTHFDTNHHLTVTWSADSIDKAMANLRATIRATIPEAKGADTDGN